MRTQIANVSSRWWSYSMKVHCKYCGRYLLEAKGTAIIENLICPNSKCKAHLNIKVITPKSTTDEINYKFVSPEIPPKEKMPPNEES